MSEEEEAEWVPLGEEGPDGSTPGDIAALLEKQPKPSKPTDYRVQDAEFWMT